MATKRQVDVLNLSDFHQQILFESYGGGISKTSSISYTNASIGVGPSSTVAPGRAMILDGITYSATENCEFSSFECYGSGSNYPAFYTPKTDGCIPAYGSLYVPKTATLRLGMIGFNATVLSVTKAGVSSPTAIPMTFKATASGKVITDDFNFKAPFTLNIISDSIGDGSGMSFAEQMWVFQVRNYLLSQGKNVRLRNWSISGSTLVQHEAVFRAGRYNYNEPGLTIICLGTNDAGAASGTLLVSLTSATNAFQSIIAQTQYLFPNQKVLVLGPATLGTANNETNLANISAMESSYVTTVGKSNLMFIPRTTFTANATNLQGDNVHPTAVGQGLIATNVTNFIGTPANGILTALT